MTAAPHETRLAEILDELSAEIEALGTSLCSDPLLCSRHGEALQAIDLIAQKQRGLAELLRAECRETAIESIGVEALRDRLRTAHPG